MANFNLNKVILGGRMTSDPELKSTPSGVTVTSFSVAVNRRYGVNGEQQTDFINCVAWRQTAEFLAKHFVKGREVLNSAQYGVRSVCYDLRQTECVEDCSRFARLVQQQTNLGNVSQFRRL